MPKLPQIKSSRWFSTSNLSLWTLLTLFWGILITANSRRHQGFISISHVRHVIRKHETYAMVPSKGRINRPTYRTILQREQVVKQRVDLWSEETLPPFRAILTVLTGLCSRIPQMIFMNLLMCCVALLNAVKTL